MDKHMENIPNELPQRLIEENLEIIVAPARDVPEEYVNQIINKSRQPHVMKYEGHEDVEGRFKDLAAYRQWAEKDRVVYLLIKRNAESAIADVGGILWFGEKHNELIEPAYNLTFGIRLYEGCVGKGLSKPFMQATHDDMQRFFPNHKLWLDFAEENIAARKAYESFGYVELAKTEDRIVMGYPKG
jgi:RimJ/RimL family protein N-acetyltransferase